MLPCIHQVLLQVQLCVILFITLLLDDHSRILVYVQQRSNQHEINHHYHLDCDTQMELILQSFKEHDNHNGFYAITKVYFEKLLKQDVSVPTDGCAGFFILFILLEITQTHQISMSIKTSKKCLISRWLPYGKHLGNVCLQ